MRVIALLLLIGCPAPPDAPPAEPSPEPTSAPDVSDPLVEAHADDVERRGTDTDSAPLEDLPGPGEAAILGHLAGCWQASSADGDRWIVAYTHPIGGVVLGTTRHVRKDALVMDEVERFVTNKDGSLSVTPIANGAPRATFDLDTDASRPGDVTFQRRGEGFPQQLRYRRGGDELDIIARDDEQALGIKLRPGPCL